MCIKIKMNVDIDMPPLPDHWNAPIPTKSLDDPYEMYRKEGQQMQLIFAVWLCIMLIGFVLFIVAVFI